MRVQIALAVIAVVAIAAVHLALQMGFVPFGSNGSAERARAEPQMREPGGVAAASQAGPARGEPAHPEFIIKRGAAVSR